MSQSTTPLRHVLTADQFDPKLIATLFARADEFSSVIAQEQTAGHFGTSLSGHILYRLFYKESTRTYESFGFAATRLGAAVLGTQSVQFSSVSKGETFEDTIKVICSYNPSIIVLRSANTGDAAKAAAVSTAPIINAGDGSGEHPTQALLDLYTIYKELGRTENLHIVMGGDLANGRTTRSLVKLASKFPGNTFTFIAPPTFEMGSDITDELDAKGIKYEHTTELDPALSTTDIVYWTRVQKERITPDQAEYLIAHPETEAHYTLGLAEVSRMKPEAKLLHPLPRVGEIKPEVDADPRAAYFVQMHYGMLARMALLEWVLGKL
jgi:aspartate carbamoyltransferase catalytic subunit